MISIIAPAGPGPTAGAFRRWRAFSLAGHAVFRPGQYTTLEIRCRRNFKPSGAESDLGIVSTGCAEATRAAVEVLERGGNAIDAAVTAALVLSVADPDASGIGGAT